ncbi:MAG: SigF/SigG family RNA polymerase sporulation sigma factor [Lachnospiraceae bacterium]|nr:SigF/SigG family RNA polymerase sporulation sigma factor [Lachnospiraceae bacterium]
MEQRELIRRSKAGDKKARETLVLNNVGLIWSIVKRFSNRGYEPEDLFQIGCIGLIKSIDKFDLSYDVKFSTYAVPMISGEIKRFLRDDGMIKVSRSLKEQAYRVSLAQEQFQKKYHREATIEEISGVTKLPVDEIVVALEANREVESLNRTIYEGDGHDISMMDMIEEKNPWEDRLMNKMLLNDVVKKLKKDEQMLIKLRYFDNKTQREIGKAMGISQVQVSRMEKKILHSLKEKMEGRMQG